MVSNIHRYLDAAVLKPTLTPAEARDGVNSCIQYRVRTACVRPCDIEMALALCAGTETEVSCVLAFPHGNAQPSIKAAEATAYVAQGVKEIDMVVNYGLILGANWEELHADIRVVTEVAEAASVPVKTILETSCLSLDQIRQATEVAIQAKASFVKTSTGFADGGASVEAVSAMLATAAGRIGVKASGGIRDRKQAEMFVDMGCSRLGIGYTSLSAICEGGGATSGEAY